MCKYNNLTCIHVTAGLVKKRVRFTFKSFLGQSKLLQAPLEQVFPQYLQASEQEAAATFQETAVLFQEGLVPLELVQATHDAVSSALESLHRLIYPNTYALLPPKTHQESSATIQVQQAPQQSLEPEEHFQSASGSDELEVLSGPNQEEMESEEPSHRPERFPPLEMTAEEVEDLMKAGVTNENMGDQMNVMMKVLNKEISMPKSLGGNTKTKRPKKIRRSRGRVLLKKVHEVKKLALKSEKKKHGSKAERKMDQKKGPAAAKAKVAPRKKDKKKRFADPKAKVAPRKNDRKKRPAASKAKVAPRKKDKKDVACEGKDEADEKKVFVKKLHSATWLWGRRCL